MKAYSYIRFSTPGQEEGDSLRRQTEQSEKYAQAHNLTLDDSLRLQDRGISAFKGAHRTKGCLGEFLRLVETGEVEPGSILLVENLDRLSRETVWDALKQLTGIIDSGIKVVTLTDRMEHTKEIINANPGQLAMSVMIMGRAHEESAIKSLRGREAWDNKRREAGSKPLTARCPAWLRLSVDRKSFMVRPEVAQVVNWIFRMKLDGKGSESIVRVLNAEKDIWRPPARGEKNPVGGWRKSYITKILGSRAVIGEYQPCKKVDGKRVPEGEPIPGYFPAIIEPELFHQVQGAISHNRETSGNAGGRNGPVSNLFGHIA
ncbi:MAG TPA: recombinase family protein, partial [Desulfobaccales bacterium]